MKPLHIILLVVAGALGGAVVTRVWQGHTALAPAPPVARVEQPAPAAAPAPAANPAPAVAPPESEPSPPTAQADEPQPMPSAKKRSPAVRRSPPPAHPRPVHLGEAIPPRPQTAAAPAPAPQPGAEPVHAPAPPTPAPVAESAPVAAPAAPAPEPEPSPKVTLNAGMTIPVRLVDSLSSDRNQAGDRFRATLDHELVVDGWVIAERGASVEGRVVSADRGSRVKGDAALTVELTTLHTSDGQAVAIQTDGFERRSATDHKTDAVKMGGGAILGAVIGGIVGGGKGAAIGAGAGAGAGAGDVLLTRKPATLPTETRVTFRLRAPVMLTEKHE